MTCGDIRTLDVELNTSSILAAVTIGRPDTVVPLVLGSAGGIIIKLVGSAADIELVALEAGDGLLSAKGLCGDVNEVLDRSLVGLLGPRHDGRRVGNKMVTRDLVS